MDKVNYHIEDEEIRDIYEGLSEPSRITNRTDEVEAMMTSGGSLFAYELMQGMVDYGADVEPPPRVTIESKDGKRFIFDGFRPEGLESDQIAAIEFTHYGPGFNPEYLLNFDGESKDYEDKMGTHGRGTKISLAYLAFNGVQTAICSYDIDHNDQPWMARTSSARTRIGGRQTVSYQFAKLDKSTPKRTTFRIENPTSEICNQFFEIRSLFLHANPMYPGAKAVLLKEDAVDVKLFEHKIENGWITCLKGVMNGDESRESFPYVYVDYLKINLGYRAAILPWSIVGLGQSENFRYQVVRSHSSTHVEHDWKIDYVLANTIRNLNDKELLRVLIRTAVNNPNTSYREFKEDGSEIEVKMADTTASLICEIWAEDFGDALITDSEDRIKYAYGDRKPDKRIIIVEDNVFKFLSEAGVKTLAKHCDIIGTRKVDHNLKIPYARQENNLEQLVASIPAADGTISVVKNPLHDLQGKFLQIRFPFAVVTEEDFSGVNANPAGNVIRSVAVVASVRNMKKLIAFCRIGDILHELHFAVQSKIDEETLFEIQVDIIKRKVAQNSPYAAYESEHTYVFLSGDEINSMSNPTRLDRLMEIFFEIVGKIRAQLEKVPLDQGVRATRAYTKGLGEKAQRRIEEKKKRRGEEKERKQKEREAAERRRLEMEQAEKARIERLKQEDEEEAVKTSRIAHVGQIRFDDNTKYTEPDESNDMRKSREETIAPVGYYLNNVASRFEVQNGRGVWKNDLNWKQVQVPEGTLKSFSGKFVLYNFEGIKSLYVPQGNKVAYFVAKGGKVSFYRDPRTGVYLMRGSAKKITYYTSRDERPVHRKATPLDTEIESSIDFDRLDPYWVEFIARHKNLSGANKSKVRAAAKAWGERFTYDPNFAYDVQVEGSSIGEISAGILNTARGICNLSATGFALLLRALRVPSRVCTGYWKHQGGGGGSHMWVEYWDGECWQTDESQVGSIYEDTSVKIAVKKGVQIDGVSKPRSRKTKEADIFETRRSFRKTILYLLFAAAMASGAYKFGPIVLSELKQAIQSHMASKKTSEEENRARLIKYCIDNIGDDLHKILCVSEDK